jgi:drug/metabolite transporter (DMT)-like permease
MWFGEKMTVLKFAGLVVGFGGIAVISADSFTGEISLIGVLMGLATALVWALSTIYIKKESPHVDPLWMVAIPNIIGGAVLTCIGAAAEGFETIRWNADFIIGLGFGAFLGTTSAFVIYNKLVNRGEASRVASFTFLVPLVSVISGTLMLNEPLTFSLLAGLIMIVLSIVFVNRPVREESRQNVSGHYSSTLKH